MFETFALREKIAAFIRKPRGLADACHFRSDILVEVRDKTGKIKSRSFQHNLRTNVGADFWNTQLFSASPGGAGAGFMALTTDATAPNATDTVLASEETTNGLARSTVLTPTHTAGTSQSVFTKTFTYTGSTLKVIAKIGLFNAATVGTLVLETLLSSTASVSSNGDTIAITWTILF